MFSIITAIFYQPFLNALILIYAGLEHVMENPDIGIAVIVFTIFIRILLLPLTIASTDSEEERLRIGRKYEKLKDQFENSEPLKFQKAKESLISDNKDTVRFEMINIGIQTAIAVILWIVFSKGFSGEHDYLLYSWLPEVERPYNLMFMGTIDLSKPDLTMNIINSILLFLMETLNLYFSPIPASGKDRVIQFTLPLISFAYLYGMPSGKKLFIITTLIISILFLLGRETMNAFSTATTKKTRGR